VHLSKVNTRLSTVNTRLSTVNTRLSTVNTRTSQKPFSSRASEPFTTSTGGCVRCGRTKLTGALPPSLTITSARPLPVVTEFAAWPVGEILPLPFLRYRRVKIQGRGRVGDRSTVPLLLKL
jgi:hypothetical protein